MTIFKDDGFNVENRGVYRKIDISFILEDIDFFSKLIHELWTNVLTMNRACSRHIPDIYTYTHRDARAGNAD